MSIITLIRHGQANSAATTEQDYDRLSQLGRQQAVWLGDHLRDAGYHFDAAFTGTLNRQVDTHAELRLTGPTVQRDDRLNEIAYYSLVDCMRDQFGLVPPLAGTGFIDHFQITFEKWEKGEIKNPPEQWDAYRDRVAGVMHDMRHAGQNVVAVTSGGIIGMAVAIALDMPRTALVKALLEGVNTGITQLHYIHGSFHVKQFNSVPHLERPDRWNARTYY